jgi:hypothetical protein
MMTKLQLLTVTILGMLREVRAAVMCATVQTPGGGGVFLHGWLSGFGHDWVNYTGLFCNRTMKYNWYTFIFLGHEITLRGTGIVQSVLQLAIGWTTKGSEFKSW